MLIFLFHLISAVLTLPLAAQPFSFQPPTGFQANPKVEMERQGASAEVYQYIRPKGAGNIHSLFQITILQVPGNQPDARDLIEKALKKKSQQFGEFQQSAIVEGQFDSRQALLSNIAGTLNGEKVRGRIIAVSLGKQEYLLELLCSESEWDLRIEQIETALQTRKFGS